MQLSSVALIMTSVLLTAFSQIMLKIGMGSTAVQAALTSTGQPLASVVAIASSPFVLVGMTAFGLSALVWLLVLSKVPVSSAYPFVSLGIVITVLAARLWLGETVSAGKGAGVLLIVAGVLTVAFSR